MPDDNSGKNRLTLVNTALIMLSIIGSIIGGYSAMVAPLHTRLESLEQSQFKGETRNRAELDKAESGLKELTTRAEGIIRQTVEDVDNKLRREASLIEEKTKIQIEELRRQIEELRLEIFRLRDLPLPAVPRGVPERK